MDRIALAEAVVRAAAMDPGVRTRIAAALARQGLEDDLRDRFPSPNGALVPLRPLFAFARLMDAEYGVDADIVWLQLTWECHERTDDSAPNLQAVESLIADAARLVLGGGGGRYASTRPMSE